MERIVAVKNSNLEISSYSDGKNLGMQAHFFKKLSYGSDFAKEIGLYEGDRLNLTEENKDAIKTYIATSLTDTIKSEYEYHKRKKVIGAKNVIVGLDKNIIRKYGAGDVKGFRNMFTDYILNQIAMSIETTMVFTGDPAFYKDLSKRVIEIIATGKDLVGVDKNYNISVIKDTIVNLADKDGKEDERYTSWKNTLADAIYKRKNNSDLKLSISKDAAMKEAINILNPYTKVNQADGLGYITPERFKQVVSGLGLWVSELHDPIFEILNNPNSNPAWLSENINTFNFPTGQSLKGQHFELINSKMGEEDILLPIYLKYSQAVLWPTVVKGTHLEDLLAASPVANIS